MARGTYSAASAGLVQLRKLDLVNNNLANVNTPGFKKQVLVSEVQSFDDTLAKAVEPQDPYARPDQERTPGVVNTRAITDFSQGSIKHTGNDLDVALRNPNEFFVIQGPEGPLYTRAGNFTLNSEGNLSTQDGFPVMGDGGEITTQGVGVSISAGARVVSNGQQVGTLQVVSVPNPQILERVGGNRFRLQEGQPEPDGVDNPEVEPHALEMSNVGAIESVIDLIKATRGFELYTKSASTIDQMNQTAVQQVGKK